MSLTFFNPPKYYSLIFIFYFLLKRAFCLRACAVRHKHAGERTGQLEGGEGRAASQERQSRAGRGPRQEGGRREIAGTY